MKTRLWTIVAAVVASSLLGYVLYSAAILVAPPRGSTLISAPPCKDCNIILIAIDPLRADGLHALGNPRSITPTLDALANQGFLFTNAFAPSSWTLPSAMSLLTGTYPSVHKIINKELIGSKKDQLFPADLRAASPGIVTLSSVLKKYGYVSGGFAGGAALDPSYGFDEGFSSYASPGEFEGVSSSISKAIDFARQHTADKMFIFLHGFDVHGQYTPPEGIVKKFVDPTYTGTLTGSAEEQKSLREEGVMQNDVHLTPSDTKFLRAIYDEKVERMDEKIAGFLAAYRALDVTRKTIIIFTSDHGEEFYEHGRIDHGMTLYDEVIHVPLIVVVPGISKSVRISDQVRILDVMPTILSLVGIVPQKSVREQLEGVSLIPTMSGVDQHLDVYAETAYRYATFQNAIRTWDGWKLTYDQESFVYHLFNIRADPGELNDLARKGYSQEQDLISKMKQMVDDLKRRRVAY